MPLRLEITSRHRRGLGEKGVKDFGADGGTIGRSLESDWVLHDKERFVSSRHASIDFRSGSYYIVDTSTNGVFVNGETKPVGRGNPQRLFDGDRLRIGEYEMLVHLVDDESTGEQLSDGSHIDPVEAAQRVGSPDPTGIEMLAEHEITAVGIDMMLNEEADTSMIRKASERAAASLRLEEDTPPAREKPATESKPSSPTRPAQHERRNEERAPGPTTGSADLSAFFQGAGLSPRKLSEKSAALLLQRLGQLTREFVIGITQQLHLRAEQKNQLRLPHTTIKPNHNNALKFSAGVDEAMTNLLLRDSPEYMSGVESAREAFEDIRVHQQAIMNAIRVAMIDYLERLDPEELQRKFHHGNKRSALIGVASKMRYWDLYTELHAVMSQHSPGKLPQLFAEELTRAYELEEARLQGKQPADESTAEAG